MIDIKDWSLLDKENLFEYLRWNSYRSERYKLFYVATPKVACTSLKWWFAALEGYSRALRGITDSIETDPDLVIHDTFYRVAPNVTGLMPEALSEGITSDSYFRFAVVRNPYKRIFSAWQSKLLLQEPLQIGPYLQCDFFHRPIECADDIAVAFEDFLVHLATNEAPDYWDVHWTPQATLLRPDLIRYSQLVKIENTKELSAALSGWLGPQFVDPFATRHTNESLIPYLPKFVTERSSELIRSLYVEDFEAFGYSMQPPEAKDAFTTDQFDLAIRAISMIRGRHQRLGEIGRQITKVRDTLEAKNDAIEVQAEEIHQLNAVVADKNAAVTHQAQEIGRLNKVVEAKDAANEAVAEELQRVHGTLLAKNDAIEVQAEEIHRLNAVVTDKEAAYQSVAVELQSVQGTLLAKNDAIGIQADEIHRLNAVVTDKDAAYQTVEEVLTNVKEELLRAEIELQAIRRTKWFRLRDAIIHQPWGFRKVARVAYLAGAMATPQLIRARLSPLVYRIRSRHNGPMPVLQPNSDENGAYLIRQPAPALPNRPRVVHIIANFMTGGSSRLVVDLIEYLGTHYEQSVVTSFIPAPPAYIGVDITEFRFPKNEQLFVDYFSQLKPDLLHVHYWGDCDELWYAKAITAAEHLGIPIIENINTPVTPYISSAVKRYIYVSDYVRQVFGQNHPSHVTIYPGSDFSHFDRKSGERVASDCIGMVYRLERDKLNEGAIAPFIRAVQKRPQTRVLIVGGGSLLEPFCQAVAEAGLNGNFEFTGYVSYDALPDLYRRMSVFVAPVWKESFGQVSPFAMNMRIPVVGYDIGAIGEIVANQALLAEPENPEMLSDIIVRLLESPAEREKLGELQQRRAQDYFSVQAMIKAYDAIYQEMMAEPTPKYREVTNDVRSTANQLLSDTPAVNTLVINSIKKSSHKKNKRVHFSIDYPKLTLGKINSPFALQGWLLGKQGWLLGKLQIQTIEVSQAGIVVASVPITIHRPDVAKHFKPNGGDDRFGFFSHLNPYLLPEQFELQVNAITDDAEKILLCTISGQRPPLVSSDLTPLLVTTLGRTGSTALLGTLGMHPNVAVYKPFDQEARYISYYMQMFKTLSSAYSWQVPLAAISENVTQDQLIGRGVPPDALLHYSVYSEMWDNFYHQYVPDLFKFCTGQLSQLYRQAAKLNGNDAPQWMVEKFVPGNEVTEVKTLFPSAREVVLVRDPRDVYCSILSFMEKKGYQGFGRECFQDDRSYLLEAFIPSVMQLYRYWKAHDNSVLLVRYEDMILEPQQTFHKICQHIGIDSTPETINQMLVKARETSKDRQEEHQTSFSIANSIGRFRSALPQSDVSLMNDLLCEPLIEFGYELCAAGKEPLFQTVPEELQHSKLCAKNSSIEVQTEEIQRPNPVQAGMQAVIKAYGTFIKK